MGAGSPALRSLLLATAAATAGAGVGVRQGGAVSRATEEWWRWTVVRLSNFMGWMQADDERGKQQFMEQWSPDLLDWYGDYRWQVGEWARSRGIAVAHSSEYEYEEAPRVALLNASNVANDTWGSNGMSVDINGSVVWHDPILFMTHAGPRWHLSVSQGIARMATVGDAVTQDNAIGNLCSTSGRIHGGYSDWENRGFVCSDLGRQLNLSEGNFSIRRHVLALRSAGRHGETLISDPTVQGYILWQYLMWQGAWRDAATAAHR